jgi:hypothetical protein
VRRNLGLFVAIVALGFAASPVLAAGPPSAALGGVALGVIPPLAQAAGLARPSGGSSSNLSYHGGPVMLTNTTYAIFWGPSNSWDSGYQTLIDRFFGDVQADNGKSTNVYASDTQYYNAATTKIAYNSTVGGFRLDTNAYPASGCTDQATAICLTDTQLQAEIKADISAAGWSAGPSKLFLIFTPKGVGSCLGSSCAYTTFCAYHNWFTSGGSPVLYANQPYGAAGYSVYTCDAGQRPNGNTADATINLLSHEHNEAITDGQGTAWFDRRGYENGDKCAWNFGSSQGTSGARYNQTINTHRYYLQQEWSNARSGCVLTGQ